jgi:transcriptional regulator with XRE-family HTH domain
MANVIHYFIIPNKLEFIFTIMDNFFSTNLRYLRKKHYKTQADIALQVGKNHTTISNWEKNIAEPNLKDLRILATFFEVSISDLLEFDLKNVHLNKKETHVKSTKNVHLNVHPYVHLLEKNGVDEANFEVSDTLNEKGSIYLPFRAVLPGVQFNLQHGKAPYISSKEINNYVMYHRDDKWLADAPFYLIPYQNDVELRVFESYDAGMEPNVSRSDRLIAVAAGLLSSIDLVVCVLITAVHGPIIRRCAYNKSSSVIVCRADNLNKELYPEIVVKLADILELWVVVERITPINNTLR